MRVFRRNSTSRRKRKEDSTLSAAQIIELLQLAPLPVEGGYFRRSYTAADTIAEAALPARYAGDRPLCGAIDHLLHDNEFSALHRLAHDDIFHFYLGDPAELLVLHPDGRHELHILGPDLLAGQRVQLVVPAGAWQGSRVCLGGQLTLLGTTYCACLHGRRLRAWPARGAAGAVPGLRRADCGAGARVKRIGAVC